MARIISLVVLTVILLLVGGLFFQVMGSFLLPLFLALVLAVVFQPLHRWLYAHCGRHERLAAALTTTSIVLLVLVPLLLLVVRAGYEARGLYLAAVSSPQVAGPAPRQGTEKKQDGSAAFDAAKLADWLTNRLAELSRHLDLSLTGPDIEASIGEAVKQFVAPAALRTTQFLGQMLGQMLVALLVMLLASYYFFADGPAMVQAIVRLSPVERGRTQELLDQFDSVTRAVVVATLATAVLEGLLMGAGFYVAGIGSVLLLTAVSMLFVLIPVVGAVIVWAPVCLWLAVMDHRPLAAVLLASYCIGMLTIVDNTVRPWLLHGRSNLHPLLALLSVLGGVQALGPIGILVGPMVVIFLQTLLNMVHTELTDLTAASSAGK